MPNDPKQPSKQPQKPSTASRVFGLPGQAAAGLGEFVWDGFNQALKGTEEVAGILEEPGASAGDLLRGGLGITATVAKTAIGVAATGFGTAKGAYDALKGVKDGGSSKDGGSGNSKKSITPPTESHSPLGQSDDLEDAMNFFDPKTDHTQADREREQRSAREQGRTWQPGMQREEDDDLSVGADSAGELGSDNQRFGPPTANQRPAAEAQIRASGIGQDSGGPAAIPSAIPEGPGRGDDRGR